MKTKPSIQPVQISCKHCGADANEMPVYKDGEVFCCNGCLSAFQILNAGGLCEYYQIAENPGNNAAEKVGMASDEIQLLEEEFLISDTGDTKVVLLHIPGMHCASCIWLLEKLHLLDKGIVSSRTNFIKKQLTIVYKTEKTSFASILNLLAAIGYKASMMPEHEDEAEKKLNQKLLIKLGVAGFCMGNIMMFSFPQYIGLSDNEVSLFKNIFDTGNVLLSLPLILYAASDYFKAFFNWISRRAINVKVPLAVGISALWGRSLYEVFTHSGPGYFDSVAGLVFFLILGQFLQNKTFDGIRFGEKAQKFFPLVSRIVVGDKTQAKKVSALQIGDRILLKNQEIIPADCILLYSDAVIDYSYATGESIPVHKVAGEILYAGGKLTGNSIQAEVVKTFQDGKFAEIWKSAKVAEEKNTTTELEKVISKWFVFGTILLAVAGLLVWLPIQPQKAWFVFTAVLMVACPCALALAPPFVWNTLAGFFAERNFFLRKPEVAGTIGEIKQIVFDKTGTITNEEEIEIGGIEVFSEVQKSEIFAVAAQSTHPYSMALAKALMEHDQSAKVEMLNEVAGRGVEGVVNQDLVKIGNAEWVGMDADYTKEGKRLFVKINNTIFPALDIADSLRENAELALNKVKEAGIQVHLASGDHWSEGENIQEATHHVFDSVNMECTPSEKVALLQNCRTKGKVVMIGDGINDAAALVHADAGIVIAKNTTQFVPEASAILLGKAFQQLPMFLELARKGNRLVIYTFLVSMTYNAAALVLAFTGVITPLIASIIMPLSSIALMVFAKVSSKMLINKYK